ncbi:MAG: RluA family pseudouridine synthase [Candidatus Taylorbacteria bacterium]
MSNKDSLNIDILYEDADCVVVNKPAGLMVHSDGRNPGPFLADWITERYPEAKDVGDPMTGSEGEQLNRGGIVHRLDRETTGVIVIAKTIEGHANLKQQFKDRTVAKKYLAFIWGEMKEDFGTIDRPIGRSSSNFRKWSAYPTARGEIREAQTYWTRVANIECLTVNDQSDGQSETMEKFALILVEPKTGRTHQIRVHMSAVNHPVVGDSLYAPRRLPALGFDRLALHSYSIEFTNMAGQKLKVLAPLPPDFANAVARFDLKLPV